MPIPATQPTVASPVPGHGGEPRGAAATLIAASIAGFLGSLMGSAVNVALPAVGQSLGADAITLNWVVTAFLLVSASLLLPVGGLADRIGCRRLFSLGLGIFIAAGAASAFAPNPAVLIALRAVQGVGGALQFSTSVALVVTNTPPTRRGAAIGISVASVYVGLAVGPFLGGLLTESLGWPSVFLLTALGALPALVLTLTVVPKDARSAGHRPFDLRGSVVYSLSLATLLYGCTRLTHPEGVGCFVLGALGLVGFVALEQRIPAPLLDLHRLLHNRVFVFSNLAAMIHYAATFAIGFFLSLYLQSVRGLGPRTAGLVLVPQPLCMALLSPLAGRLSDRIEARWLASAGMVLTALGLGILLRLDAETPLEVVIGSLMLLGVGFALFSSPNTNAVVSSVARSELGLANATLATMRNVGMALSMAFALLLISEHVGPVKLGPETAEGLVAALRTAFTAFGLAAVVGALASLARGAPVAPAPAPHTPRIE
ncbi:MAG: MFS transporter [Polyangiaceae bacterium]|nr:MFS transporter [Polyangiaceae bacterium]